MTDHLWLNIILILGAVGAAEEAVRRIIGRPVVRAWRKFEKFLDAWVGEPARDGLPPRPGVVDRIIAIEYQVHNNGGGSLKDDVGEGVRIARESLNVSLDTKAALDAHVEQSKELMADGDAREQRIWDALDNRKAMDHLTEALPIVARSTPHEEGRDDA